MRSTWPAASAATGAGPGLENHPAFVLGHLCTGSALMAERLGGEAALPHGWADFFQRGAGG